MQDVQIELSALWVALMLTYLLGDVLRIYAGDFKPGELGGMQITQGVWLGIAALFVIPVFMVFLSLTLNYPVNRSTNIIAGTVYTAVTLFTQFILPIRNGTTTTYYIFFGIIEIPCTSFIVWYAWKWPKAEVSVSVQ
jgi:hypothetical protein